ncbi:MAG TPA: DUF2442 domain-containing protein [Terriglobales bacterium]|nr:DUF2442 domain-containing protein [Terriglobales bacterium]
MSVQLSVDEKPELTVLVHDPGAQTAVPAAEGIRVVRHPHTQTAQRARNVFVLVLATELPEVAEFVSLANRRHQLRALFVQENMDAHWLPFLFERAGLRTLRNTLVHKGWTVPSRVLRAWAHGAQDELIADASVADDRLFVTSCALESLEVPLVEIPALKSVSASDRRNFEIDEDGSYLHWPGPDVHLDLDSIRVAIDPSARKRAFHARAVRNLRFGKAIAQLRTARGLKQSDIPGLSERQVRRMERGESSGYESLSRMAAAHGMSIDHYLDEAARIAANITDGPSEQRS